MRRYQISRLKRHFRRRKTGRVRTEFFIGRVAHLQFKRATVDDVSMAEPDLVQRLAIEPDALNVFIVFLNYSGKRFLRFCRLDARIQDPDSLVVKDDFMKLCLTSHGPCQFRLCRLMCGGGCAPPRVAGLFPGLCPWSGLSPLDLLGQRPHQGRSPK